MATAKTYEDLQDDVKKTLIKWQPLIEKCGHLETLDEKLLLANTLEKLRETAYGSGDGSHSHVLHVNETMNVVDPTETNRLVISYDGKGNFTVIPQHKDWVNNIS